MDKDTLRALKDSIEKWRQIERGEMADLASDNCMLCQKFTVGAGSCRGCPVMERSGCDGCRGTPYTNWVLAHPPFDDYRVADTPELVRLARAERKFLESLLP